MTTNVIRFPDTGIARLRRQLVICHSERMIDRWCERLERAAAKSEITRSEYAALLDRSMDFPTQSRIRL